MLNGEERKKKREAKRAARRVRKFQKSTPGKDKVKKAVKTFFGKLSRHGGDWT